MKKIGVVLLFLLSAQLLCAQKYGASIGARFGDQRYGMGFRHRIVKSFSVEAMGELAPQLMQLSIYPKYHLPLLGEGLNLYFGVGGHIGQQKEVGNVYGYGFMTGLEWKLPVVPLVVSADIKPSYYVEGSDWFEFPAAVSVHYVLSKATKEERKKAREKRRKRKERKKRRENRRENRMEWFENLKSGGAKD